MSFVDSDSLSLAGLDVPDLHLHTPSVSSSLTAHCHSSCTTSTCMRDSRRRGQKHPHSSPAATVEVRIDIRIGPPIIILFPLHRIDLRLRPPAEVTYSNPFHPSQKFPHSTSRSSGTRTMIRPPYSRYPLQSSLQNLPCIIPRWAQQMVTMQEMTPVLRRSPNPQGSSISATIRIPPGQAQYDVISCHVQTVPSRESAGILDQNRGAALEPLIPPVAARASPLSDAMSQVFAGFVGSHGKFASLRTGCTLSKLSYKNAPRWACDSPNTHSFSASSGICTCLGHFINHFLHAEPEYADVDIIRLDEQPPTMARGQKSTGVRKVLRSLLDHDLPVRTEG